MNGVLLSEFLLGTIASHHRITHAFSLIRVVTLSIQESEL